MADFTILEPMSTGDVIDRAVRLYRRNFTSLVAIVTVPTLVGYIASLMFWYGYTNLFINTARPGAAPDDAVWMLILGLIGYPVWFFVLLFTVCGLSRVIGDNVMMGAPITFRRCFATARRRIGDVLVMGLMLVGLLLVMYIALVFALFILIMIIGLIGSAVVAAHLPQWAMTLIIVVAIVAGIAIALMVVSLITARFVFMPQALMIEGVSAGSSFGRAARLGSGNWYRVGSIMLFAYFVSLSLMGALTLPLLAAFYLAGWIGQDFFSSTTWNVFYTSFSQIASLLSLPIWIVSFTLLYFDSRVRKEAYDIELLARDVAPGFTWQAPPPPAYVGWVPTRAYVQTGPLGLGGFNPVRPPPPVPVAPPPPADDLRTRFDRAAADLNEHARATDWANAPVPPAILTGAPGATAIAPIEASDGAVPAGIAPVSSASIVCERCGITLDANVRFCSHCGNPVRVSP